MIVSVSQRCAPSIRRGGKYVFALIRRISQDKRIVCQRGSWWDRLWQRNQQRAEDALIYDA